MADGEAHAGTSGRSVRPDTPITFTLGQAVSYALAIAGVGFAVGAVYPRLLSVELAVEQLQKAQSQQQRSQERMANTLARVTTIVERLDEHKVVPPYAANDADDAE